MPNNRHNLTFDGPIDLDRLDEDIFSQVESGEKRHPFDGGLNDDDSGDLNEEKFFYNPNKRLLDNDASLIPGSPFSKPGQRVSNRPTEPLEMARYASLLSVVGTVGWVGYLFFIAVTQYNSLGRILVEAALAVLSFFGLFWNTYFMISSVFKCFIPVKAFRSNTKYCSVVPESKPDAAPWLDVTIQIPVYKESLLDVLMPTLKSCIKARDRYTSHTKARCNIVICDDGIMALLKNNFPVAEMLWTSIVETRGQVVKLGQLLKRVPTASLKHLKGLRTSEVYQVFHRMLYYYHNEIGFVARSTVNRRGKFKKASNLNSHLRLAFGAAQRQEEEGDITFREALLLESHLEDDSRFIMFGNDIMLGDLIVVNDADARMAESVIEKTVPEFINDASLGFTQHTTKTLEEQVNESYYTKMLTHYTNALYGAHFLLSSIMGCHAPLVGHSVFLRTDAIKGVGRVRSLHKAQVWLKSIGLPFLPVDQVGFGNLHAENRIEFWDENRVSEDFELMISLYSLGFNGRYVAYPDCEFQEGITRTFDEEAGRHRKFALGAHELVFNPFTDWVGHGVFTPLWRTFLACDIPSYYKVYLTAYLCSYASGGAYLVVFTIAAIARILDVEDDVQTLYSFSPAGVIVLNMVAFYVLGYATFIIAMLRMYWANSKLIFREYRDKPAGALYLVFCKLRYCLLFQFLFYTVASITFYFLGSMDHMLARPGIVGATNKDSITLSRYVALWETIKFNVGSYMIAFVIMGLAFFTIVQEEDWDLLPESALDNKLLHALFAGPAFFLGIMILVVPILMNPYILGWPFYCASSGSGKEDPDGASSNGHRRVMSNGVVGLQEFMDTARQLDNEVSKNRIDVEIGTVRDLMSKSSGERSPRQVDRSRLGRELSEGRAQTTLSIPENLRRSRPSSTRGRSSRSSSRSRARGNRIRDVAQV